MMCSCACHQELYETEAGKTYKGMVCDFKGRRFAQTLAEIDATFQELQDDCGTANQRISVVIRLCAILTSWRRA